MSDRATSGGEMVILTPTGERRGGSEVMLVRFLESARELGHEVHVIFLEPGDHFDEVRSAGHSCELVDAGRLRQAGRWLGAMMRIGAILRSRRPQVMVGWQAKSVSYGGLPAAWTGVPFVCFHRGNPSNHYIDRLSYSLPCDGYLANSGFTAERLSRFTKRPVSVVPSAVDTRAFDPDTLPSCRDAKARLGFDPSRPLIGLVGRVQPWKGTHHFVQAIEHLLSTHPHCQGVVVGGHAPEDSAYAAELEARVANLPIRMAGSQSDVPLWMSAMDVVVHASHEEPFGLVVIEAMSLGKPVVATSPGGPAEVIEHGSSGLLVPHGDSVAIAKAVAHFLDRPVDASACAASARVAAAKFDSRNYAARVRSAALGLCGDGDFVEERSPAA